MENGTDVGFSSPSSPVKSPLLHENDNVKKREEWNARSDFLFNAVGTSVGIGSMWRFPALTYKYGGGFFLIYMIALVCIGYPLLLLEIGLGQYFQTGDVGVFGSIHPRLRGVGVTSVITAFLFIGYYIPMLSWIVRGYVNTFSVDDGVSGSDEFDYFFLDIIGMKTLGDDFRPTRMVWGNICYLFFFWCFIGVMVASGMKYVGRLAYVTMFLLVINIYFFTKEAASLEGSMQSIRDFIGQLNLSGLVETPEVWSIAVVEVFYGLGGCTFGLMTAMASHLPKDSPAAENASIIAISNIFFNIVGSFCMFSCIGMLEELEFELDEIAETLIAGPAILFSSYPDGLPPLPGGITWFQLTFLNFLLLGIDNAFAFAGTLRDAFDDSHFGKDISGSYVVGATISACLVSGLIYHTDAGLILLDSIDFYVNFLLLIIGACKTFSAGWVCGMNRQFMKYGQDIVYTLIATSFGSLLISCCVWFLIDEDTILWFFITYSLLYAIGLCTIVFKIKSKHLEVKPALHDLFFGDVLEMTRELESTVGKIPMACPFLLKHFIPQVLIVLFMNLAFAENSSGQSKFGHYREYSFWPFQVLGLSVVVLVLVVLSVGVMKPDIYVGFTSVYERDFHAVLTSRTKESEEKSDDLCKEFEIV